MVPPVMSRHDPMSWQDPGRSSFSDLTISAHVQGNRFVSQGIPAHFLAGQCFQRPPDRPPGYGPREDSLGVDGCPVKQKGGIFHAALSEISKLTFGGA